MKPKILIISALGLWNYGPRWEIFSRFAKAEYEVHYVSPFNNSSSVSGIFLHKINVPFLKIMEGRLFVWVLFMILSVKEAIELVKKDRPNVLYGYEVFGAIPAYIISKIFRIPLILRFQGTILFPHLGKKSLLLLLHHVIAFKLPADFLIIDNDGTFGDIVAKCLKVPQNRIRLWRLGIDKHMSPTLSPKILKAQLGVPRDAKVVMSLGRLAGWKRVDRLIEAASFVIAKRKDVFFVIVGEGSEKSKLIQLACKLKISQYVKFVGHIPYEGIPNYLAMADIFVTVQDLTCMSVNLMEAMVCGKCIVALNSGDIGRVIKNGNNGVLLNYSELPRLPSILIGLLNNEDYRRMLENNSRGYAINNFCTWEERTEAELLLVRKLMEK